MTRGMAFDHAADEIRANAISPGYVVTDYHIGDRTGEGVTKFVERETTPSEDGPGILKNAVPPRKLRTASSTWP